MRFFYVKKEQICRHCKTTIERGEEAVVERWKTPSGALIPLVVHTVCFIPWKEDLFNRLWVKWKEGSTPRKKIGRPLKSSNPKEYRRLMALQRYHKKGGNLARVEELAKKIEEIQISHANI